MPLTNSKRSQSVSRIRADLLQAIREAKAKVIQAKEAMLEMSHRIDQPHLCVIAKSELALAGSDLKVALIDLQQYRYKAELEAEFERKGEKELGDILELINFSDRLLTHSLDRAN
jgi:hypothetical protein